MSTTSDFNRLARAWLDEGPSQLSDAALDAALQEVHLTRQRRALRVPWRFLTMPAISRATGIAAVALVAVVGAGGIIYLSSSNPGGVGSQKTQTPTAAPTARPTAAPTPAATPAPTGAAPVPEDGPMQAGTYLVRPLPAPDDGLTVTFTVPDGWYGFGGTFFPDSAPGIAFQFLDATSVNSDLCQWEGPDGDVSAGATVDDLVEALVAQTAYEVSDPVDVSIGGYSGKRVDVVFPAELFDGSGSSAPDCDGGVARLWSTSSHGEIGIYAQAPEERWRANILDVEGTRLVIVAQDDRTTSAEDRVAGDAIIASMVIEP